MREFKKKLVQRNYLLLFAAVLIIIVTVLMQMKTANNNAQDFIKGYVIGLSTVIEVFLVISIIQNIRAIKKEEILQKKCIEEHDERALLIYQKVGSLGSSISIILLMILTIIAGYFNEIVFFSFLAATMVTVFVKAAVKIYYYKKY